MRNPLLDGDAAMEAAAAEAAEGQENIDAMSLPERLRSFVDAVVERSLQVQQHTSAVTAMGIDATHAAGHA